MDALLIAGAANILIAVALGAFGAHALKARLSGEQAKTYQTAVHYQMAHALGLMLIALTARERTGDSLLHVSGWLILAGIALFSGSLYALSLTGRRKLGAVTPLGGLAFLGGWALFIAALL